MQGYLAYYFILCVACLGTSTARPWQQISSNTIIDVIKFGAIGDGKTDDSNVINLLNLTKIEINNLYTIYLINNP